MNREAFLAACKVAEQKTRTVDVPGFGAVCFKELNDQERVEKWDNWVAPKGKLDQSRLNQGRWYLITITAVDENGKTFLTLDDMELLKALPCRVITQMNEAAWACAGLSKDDIDEVLKKKSSSLETITDDIAN